MRAAQKAALFFCADIFMVMEYKDFFYYLFENQDKHWSAYWMDPTGNFQEVYLNGSKNGHFNFAREWLKSKNLISTGTSPTEDLMKRRWIRVTYNYYSDRIMHIEHSQTELTAQMLRSLRNKAYELGASKIIDDTRNGEIDI